jgi:hypothetical protein
MTSVLGHRYSQRKDHAKTWGRWSSIYKPGKDLRKKSTLQLQKCEKISMWLKLLSLWYFVMADLAN